MTNEEAVIVWQARPDHREMRKKALMFILKNNYGLIHDLALRTKNSRFNSEDYKNHAIPFIMRSMDEFDVSRGLKFISFLVWQLRAALTRFNNHEGVVKPHISKAEKEGKWKTKVNYFKYVSMEDPDYDSQRSLLDTLPAQQDEKPHDYSSYMTAIMSELCERDRKILSDHYGLSTGYTKTMEQIGGEIGLTRERVRQVREEVLRKLRRLISHKVVHGDSVFKEMQEMCRI